MSDSNSDIEEMKGELSEWTILTKPVSTTFLSLLGRLQGNEAYFKQGTNSKDDHQREKVQLYFHAAFFDRTKLYFPILLTVLGIGFFDSCGVGILPLQGYGLILDGLGAIIIAIGLFRGVEGVIRDTPKTSTGMQFGGSIYYNSEPLSSTVRNTVDGIFGSGFLVIGFSIQLYAISGLSLSIC